MTRTPNIMLCAVEPSGDVLGAELMQGFADLNVTPEFSGCGGPMMEAAGLKSLAPIDPFSVIGPVGAIKALPAASRTAKLLATDARDGHAEAAVFIDGWSFARLAAEKFRRYSPQTKLFKYVAPQVWGSRPHRVKQVSELFDGLLTLFPFETPWFENEPLRLKCVGNSMFQKAAAHETDPAGFRARHKIKGAPLLLVAPGSRPSEIKKLLTPFRETVEILTAHIPELRIAITPAAAVEATIRSAVGDWPGAPIMVNTQDRYDAFAAADAALAASGTVTTEIAIQGTPMIAAYRLDPISVMWVRRVSTTPYASMVNIAAGHEIIPEFIQENCQPTLMASALGPLLADPAAGEPQRSAFPQSLAKLGAKLGDEGPPAGRAAAETLLDWIG